MKNAAVKNLAAVVATLALGLTVSGCADDEPAPKAGDHTHDASHSHDLATAEAGDLKLEGGFAYATAPMDMESSDGAMDMESSDGAMDMESSDGAMDMESSDGAMDDDMAAMGMMTAAFGTISNAGDTDDALVGVTTEITDMAQTHETVPNEDGTGGTMREVKEIVVPAGGSVKLEPGGFHIMLMDLKSDLAAGTTVKLTLAFRSGTTMTVDFPVIDREDRPQS